MMIVGLILVWLIAIPTAFAGMRGMVFFVNEPTRASSCMYVCMYVCILFSFPLFLSKQHEKTISVEG